LKSLDLHLIRGFMEEVKNGHQNHWNKKYHQSRRRSQRIHYQWSKQENSSNHQENHCWTSSPSIIFFHDVVEHASRFIKLVSEQNQDCVECRVCRNKEEQKFCGCKCNISSKDEKGEEYIELHGGSWWKEATVGLVGQHVAMHFVFTVNYFSLFKGFEPIIFLCR